MEKQLSSLFGLDFEEDPMAAFNYKARVVLAAVLAFMFWSTALAMGWLMALGLLNCHWAAFAGIEAVTVFLALSYSGQLVRAGQ